MPSAISRGSASPRDGNERATRIASAIRASGSPGSGVLSQRSRGRSLASRASSTANGRPSASTPSGPPRPSITASGSRSRTRSTTVPPGSRAALASAIQAFWRSEPASRRGSAAA